MLSAFDMVADAHRARARTLSLVAAARNTRSDLPSWKRNTIDLCINNAIGV